LGGTVTIVVMPAPLHVVVNLYRHRIGGVTIAHSMPVLCQRRQQRFMTPDCRFRIKPANLKTSLYLQT
jgi:hypothetical protein